MPRPAWMITGSRRSSASAKTGSSAGSASAEASARGCSLMPARAGGQRALGLGERVVARVEPAERHEPPVADSAASARMRSFAGAVAVGLGQREERGAPADQLERLEQPRRR